jgi:hypothetical protein
MGKFEAPIAIFKLNYTAVWQCEPYYLLIQHGSYLLIPVREQPIIESGFILLYRGIGSSDKFNLHHMPEDAVVVDHYRRVLINSFSNSVISFNAAHSSLFRTETCHLQDDRGKFWAAHLLFDDINITFEDILCSVNQCYTLSKELAERKFGPSYAVFKTPVTNIRICTYFAGESEVKILSLDNLIPVEAIQCEFS